MKISSMDLSYRVDKIFIRKISKERNPTNIAGEVTGLILCTSSNNGLYLYLVS